METLTNFTNTIKEKFSTKVVPDNEKRKKIVATVKFDLYNMDTEQDVHPNTTPVTSEHLTEWAEAVIFSIIDFGENMSIKNIEDNIYEIKYYTTIYHDYDMDFIEEPDEDGNYPIVQKPDGQIIIDVPHDYKWEDSDIGYYVSVDIIEYQIYE